MKLEKKRIDILLPVRCCLPIYIFFYDPLKVCIHRKVIFFNTPTHLPQINLSAFFGYLRLSLAKRFSKNAISFINTYFKKGFIVLKKQPSIFFCCYIMMNLYVSVNCKDYLAITFPQVFGSVHLMNLYIFFCKLCI